MVNTVDDLPRLCPIQLVRVTLVIRSIKQRYSTCVTCIPSEEEPEKLSRFLFISPCFVQGPYLRPSSHFFVLHDSNISFNLSLIVLTKMNNEDAAEAKKCVSPLVRQNVTDTPYYVDYSHLNCRNSLLPAITIQESGKNAFPAILHYMLNDCQRDGFSNVVSWQPHGRCFVVHDHKSFSQYILPW